MHPHDRHRPGRRPVAPDADRDARQLVARRLLQAGCDRAEPRVPHRQPLAGLSGRAPARHLLRRQRDGAPRRRGGLRLAFARHPGGSHPLPRGGQLVGTGGADRPLRADDRDVHRPVPRRRRRRPHAGQRRPSPGDLERRVHAVRQDQRRALRPAAAAMCGHRHGRGANRRRSAGRGQRLRHRRHGADRRHRRRAGRRRIRRGCRARPVDPHRGRSRPRRRVHAR